MGKVEESLKMTSEIEELHTKRAAVEVRCGNFMPYIIYD